MLQCNASLTAHVSKRRYLCQAKSPVASMLIPVARFDECKSSGLTLESQDGR